MIENRTYHSSDSPQYFYTSSISEEFDNLFLDLFSKHKYMPFHIFVVLRCLFKSSNWKTKGRFYITDKSKNTIEGELCLGIDVVVLEEELEKIPNIRANKVVQRLMFGEELFSFLTDKFAKSKIKVPYLKIHKDELLSDIKKWCLENYWLKESLLINFKIENWTLSKAELVFGKPFFKKVTNEINENIHLEIKPNAIKWQNLMWHIDENRHIESWFYLNENKEWLCCWYDIK
ncbi:hypothetical protein [uncultured Flavobacterium sp.]|uniref:hypothetical protein n=1 Tax=uncultured Flavobacterium sp. TaxID=165435 RepID=UPI0025E80982|nr:hypothetical protein [uncultured Flavobacterium sp.]